MGKRKELEHVPAGLIQKQHRSERPTTTRKETPEAKEQRLNYLFGDGEFHGDSYEFLTMIYKRPEFPLRMRISAAEVCIRYDRPALMAASFKEVKSNGDDIVTQIMGALNGNGRELPPPREEQSIIDASAEDVVLAEVEAE